jgi:DNA-binding MarR family transcriptional regulator
MEASSRCVCATLRKATRSVTQLYDNALRPSGLRSTQFNILAEIYGAGEANLKTLGQKMAMDQTTLTRSLALLERDGLLERVPKPDARVKSLRLSKKGGQILKEAFPLWAGAQKEMLARITPEVWALLSDQLEDLSSESV